MGVDAGDLDGDGLPDIVVANYESETNEYYRNLGVGHLRGPVALLGVRAADRALTSGSA